MECGLDGEKKKKVEIGVVTHKQENLLDCRFHNVFGVFWCVFPFWLGEVPAEPNEEHPMSWPWPHLVTAHYFHFCGCLLRHSQAHWEFPVQSEKLYRSAKTISFYFSVHPTSQHIQPSLILPLIQKVRCPFKRSMFSPNWPGRNRTSLSYKLCC